MSHLGSKRVSSSPPGTPSSARAPKKSRKNRPGFSRRGSVQSDGGTPGPAVPGPSKGKEKDDGQAAGAEDDAEKEDEEELLEMAEDEFATQSQWQKQSKVNLRVLMDNFSDDQHKRYEWYRRAALNKGNIRKVINQTLNHSVSPNVAQVIAGVAKVFVGEIVEKARKVQAKAGESGPLAPEHLREAYRLYQEEAGRVGAARPMKGKRIFMR